MTLPALIYGTGAYGAAVYGSSLALEYNATLTAVCTDYATVRLAWGYPAGAWSMFRITRNPNGPPMSPEDGTLVDVDVEDYSYIDTDVIPGRRYHYAAFVFAITKQAWVRAGDADVLVVKDYGYTDALWARLPHLYKDSDVLYDFLSLFGFQLDALRTEYASLLELSDAGRTAYRTVASLLAQFGFDAEPELGPAASRRLISNAVHLYATKGAALSAENLATLLTGWDAVLRTGYNRLLDNLDTLTELSPGRWDSALVNAAVEIRSDDPTIPHGSAYAVFTAQRAGVMSTSFADTSTARLQGVPVIEGQAYLASAYVRGVSIETRILIDWYDAYGQLIDTTFGSASEIEDDWSTRLTVAGSAPATTATAALRILTGIVSAGQELAINAVQFSETTGDTRPWRPARELLLVVRGDLVNEIVNPDGTTGLQGWTEDAALSSTPQGFTYTW